jgi:hypothetical protein
MRNLARDYIVWDTATKISFTKHGLGKVSANAWDDRSLAEIQSKSCHWRKPLERFCVKVQDEQGGIIDIAEGGKNGTCN